MRYEVGVSSILHLPSCLLSLLSSFLYLHSSILRPRARGLILSDLPAPSEARQAGSLKEHDCWQVVRGEEGLVVVPLMPRPD
jgi:hypothetical protein